jgi:hypothetical protein
MAFLHRLEEVLLEELEDNGGSTGSCNRRRGEGIDGLERQSECRRRPYLSCLYIDTRNGFVL